MLHCYVGYYHGISFKYPGDSRYVRSSLRTAFAVVLVVAVGTVRFVIAHAFLRDAHARVAALEAATAAGSFYGQYKTDVYGAPSATSSSIFHLTRSPIHTTTLSTRNFVQVVTFKLNFNSHALYVYKLCNYQLATRKVILAGIKCFLPNGPSATLPVRVALLGAQRFRRQDPHQGHV